MLCSEVSCNDAGRLFTSHPGTAARWAWRAGADGGFCAPLGLAPREERFVGRAHCAGPGSRLRHRDCKPARGVRDPLRPPALRGQVLSALQNACGGHRRFGGVDLGGLRIPAHTSPGRVLFVGRVRGAWRGAHGERGRIVDRLHRRRTADVLPLRARWSEQGRPPVRRGYGQIHPAWRHIVGGDAVRHRAALRGNGGDGVQALELPDRGALRADGNPWIRHVRGGAWVQAFDGPVPPLGSGCLRRRAHAGYRARCGAVEGSGYRTDAALPCGSGAGDRR